MVMAMADIIIVDIAVTMSIEQRHRGQKLVVFLSFGIGILLFSLAAPRFSAYYRIANVPSEVSRTMASGGSLSETMLLDARQHYSDALAVLPNNAELQRTYGRLELRRAVLADQDSEHYLEAMNSAAAHFRAAIMAAPSDAFSWALAGYASTEISEPLHKINALMRMSYFLGPNEGSSILLRAQVASQLWKELDSDVQNYTRNDFRAIWRNGGLRQSIVDIYLNSSLEARVVIREAIVGNKNTEQKFNNLLAKAIARSRPRQSSTK